ncbi:MAG: hypothetical protein CL927_00250 [Deltaproteobacteria bacterium]|nr:hypothetical protein [Deltaproteobacteria bacterium]HCH66723.1 hypothetical protein [Deltaproteobacteria bacterium]
MPFSQPLTRRLKRVFGASNEYVAFVNEDTVGDILTTDFPVPGRMQARTSKRRQLAKMSREYSALKADNLPAQKAKLLDILDTADAWLSTHEDDEDAPLLGTVHKIKLLRSQAVEELLELEERIDDAGIVIPELTALDALDNDQVSHALIGQHRTEQINRLVSEYNQLQEADLDGRKAALLEIVSTAAAWLMDSQHVQDPEAKRRAIQQVLRSTQEELSVVSAGAMNVDRAEGQDTAQPVEIGRTEEGMTAFSVGLAANDVRGIGQFIEALKGAHTADTAYHTQLAGAIDDTRTGATALASGDFGGAWDRVMEVLEAPIVSKMFSAIGIVLAAKALKAAWDDRKALRATVKGASGDLLVAATYGLAKVTRRFYLVLKTFIFALTKGVMHLITVISGGLGVLFTETAAIALTLTDATITVGLAIKGAYKAWKGTRGKNRARFATAMIDAALLEWQERARGREEDFRPGPALILVQRFGLKNEQIIAAADDNAVKTSLVQEIMTHLKSK